MILARIKYAMCVERTPREARRLNLSLMISHDEEEEELNCTRSLARRRIGGSRNAVAQSRYAHPYVSLAQLQSGQRDHKP